MYTRAAIAAFLALCFLPGCAGGDDEAAPGRIAYRTLVQGYGEIWVMDADGSNARRVTQPEPAGSHPDNEGSKTPALSPDGERVAYARGDARGLHSSYDLWVVDVDGGEPRRLTDDALPDGDPAWSPDGKQIAYTQGDYSPLAVQIVDVETGDRRTLTGDGSSPTWSPDGRRIAFARTTPGTEGPQDAAIYVVDADGRTPPRLVVDRALSPAWSPAGERIAFMTYAPYPCGSPCDAGEISTVNVDGSGLRPVTSTADALDAQPAWSPDGSAIVFMSRSGGDHFELWAIEVDGSSVRRLTTNDVYDGEPDWR